ncbi:hypothetical protein ALI144C_15165 [Actinosynnema sp. ALI-1.44]|uniref:sensor histidine kinase n=1 Tax=Actinosynnema sp. ALI-1.44 TaxID=1933779 RepID=UPI00097C1D18|nr:sensor histidine kinase [Actinosynnema sp. ALI-1.44]ONI84485.1 hypothetical protein ALI144C_15165 [Actinosynnema sp. ALI-1.44]
MYVLLLSVGVCLPLLFVRRLPLTMAILSAIVATAGTGYDIHWPGRLVAAAGFCLAAYHRPRLTPVAVASLTWTFVFGLLAGSPTGVIPATDVVIMGVAPIAVGYGVRLQRELARLRIAEHRAQLARDVHDSVGHHLTAIKMQAAAAQRVPATAARALSTITELSATALSEVRDFVRDVRMDIPDLAERLAGPDRRITTSGSTAGLPPAVGQAAYRIVQEALTNAVRHSDATRIDVRLRQERETLTVSVADNGTAASFVEGNGIRGIRERVDLLGGNIHIGPTGGGWKVEASLPVRR